jgi:hypothetical protein
VVRSPHKDAYNGNSSGGKQRGGRQKPDGIQGEILGARDMAGDRASWSARDEQPVEGERGQLTSGGLRRASCR